MTDRAMNWTTGLTIALGLLVGSAVASAQTTAPSDEDATAEAVPNSADVAVEHGVQMIVDMQEGDGNAEWPYEGVYRVRGRIPIGYRVGGTGIAVLALTQAPGYVDDVRRQDAVERGVGFIVASIERPLMSPEVASETRYDVRGWGYTYGLSALLRLKRLDLVPAAQAEEVDVAIRFYLRGIAQTTIPQNGGWNYSRRAGFDKPGRPSPFMTAPTLLALFEARTLGYEIDETLIQRGLDALENARTLGGSYQYAGSRGPQSDVATPGAVGRMLASEVALHLGGRSEAHRVRGAIDAFIVHWDWLEKRRAQNGTHVPPYGIAPYYFYFAHYYAAVAIEQLPESERVEYRRRLEALLFRTRNEDGGWNDRVFPRSANYGTAMSVLALTMPQATPPAAWTPASTISEPETSP